MTKKILGAALLILVVIIAAVYWLGLKSNDVEAPVQSFQECVDAGNPIMESYPEQCRTPDGRTFVNPDQVVDTPSNEVDTSTEDTSDTQNNATGTVICTLEAKICPDGSVVGRMGPNCEFAPCPEQ